MGFAILMQSERRAFFDPCEPADRYARIRVMNGQESDHHEAAGDAADTASPDGLAKPGSRISAECVSP